VRFTRLVGLVFAMSLIMVGSASAATDAQKAAFVNALTQVKSVQEDGGPTTQIPESQMGRNDDGTPVASVGSACHTRAWRRSWRYRGTNALGMTVFAGTVEVKWCGGPHYGIARHHTMCYEYTAPFWSSQSWKHWSPISPHVGNAWCRFRFHLQLGFSFLAVTQTKIHYVGLHVAGNGRSSHWRS